MPGEHLGLIVMAASAMLTTQAVAAQSAGPNAEVEATIEAALSAAQSGDMQKLHDQYASDCIFIDEFAPFSWSGPNAIDNYLASAAQMYQETQHRDVKITAISLSYVYVSGDRAYVVEHLTEAATVKGKPYESSGSLAFTLARSNRVWKIASQAWVKASENVNPY